MQTLGDFLGYNPHCHILVTDGCIYGNKGMFRVTPPLELKSWRPSSNTRWRQRFRRMAILKIFNGIFY
jgi:hypothetical protein